ncbi:hypothetical protein [Paraburkholderia hospita]|uniref:hypothetical protein n=1 Tax=Paraburkholderia hospita TaxID=169430 RepID=UPI0002719C45|nr:hypothetical protein [Paraburkholderia hospita]EUC18709.1 hypothetical protein PMI06_003085 [Burkholderia sp. BT03]SKC62305.1 hypothetical protein SAMN06266956_1255 [Paraburkholderia hospita]
MDSSTSFAYSTEQAEIKTLYFDNGPDLNKKLVTGSVCLHRPPARQRVSLEKASGSTTFAQPTTCAIEEPSYEGLPPLGLPAACGDHDPGFVRFLDGPDSAARAIALQERLRHECGKLGRMFLILSWQGELSLRLGAARIATQSLYARSPERPVVVGIDGIDQCLESPSHRAFQVKRLIDVGAIVIGAVDGRYGDSRLLKLHLRTLGVTVIHEKLVTGRRAKERAVHERPRPSDATRSVAVGRFPEIDTPALAACGYKFRQHRVSTAKNSFAGRKEPEKRSELRHNGRSDDTGDFTSTGLEREDYARAYRNAFAMNRLLCEGKKL